MRHPSSDDPATAVVADLVMGLDLRDCLEWNEHDIIDRSNKGTLSFIFWIRLHNNRGLYS